MKQLALLLCVASYNIFANEWTGPFSLKDLNGTVIVSVIDKRDVVVFVENGKLYSNVISKENCDFAIGVNYAGGSGDSNTRSIFTTLTAKNDKRLDVKFEIGLKLDNTTKMYSVIKLNRKLEGDK